MTEQNAIATDLPDLTDAPLDELDDDEAAEADDTLRRVAPGDGSRLLVAAAFNSAI